MNKDTKERSNFSILNSEIKEYGNKKILDYNTQDFRNFWESGSKSILNKTENDLLKKMIPRSKGWFFDIGCGFGRNVPAYYNTNKKIVLVDYAVNHLEMAAKEHSDKKNIYYIAADAYKLPFKNCVFKNGISIRLLHHLNRPIDFIESLYHILDEKGHVTITYINRRNFFRIFKYGKESFKNEHSELSKMIYGTHPKFFKRISNYSGFDIVKVKGSGFIHQLAHSSEKIETFINKHTRLNKILTIIDVFFNSIFGKLKLSLVQFVLLKKYKNCGRSKTITLKTLDDILKCPNCNNIDLLKEKNYYKCSNCKKTYPVINNIIDFRIQKHRNKII